MSSLYLLILSTENLFRRTHGRRLEDLYDEYATILLLAPYMRSKGSSHASNSCLHHPEGRVWAGPVLRGQLVANVSSVKLSYYQYSALNAAE